MTVFKRYLLLQIPGWMLTVAILYWLHRWLGLPVWAAALLLAGEVAKDFILYPKLRRAYESDEKTGADRLIGIEAVVRQRLAPEGYVEIRGELWRARPAGEEATLEVGAAVRVVDAGGLLLTVVAEQSPGREEQLDRVRPAS